MANEIGSVGQAQCARAIHGRQIRAVHTPLRRGDDDNIDGVDGGGGNGYDTAKRARPTSIGPRRTDKGIFFSTLFIR